MHHLLHARRLVGAALFLLAAASAPLSAQPEPPPEGVERRGTWSFTGNCLDCLDRYNLDNPDAPLTEYLVNATIRARTFWEVGGRVGGIIEGFRYEPTNLVPGGVNIDPTTTTFSYAGFSATGDELTSLEFYWSGGFFRLGPQPYRISPQYILGAGEWELCLSDDSVCAPPLVADYGNQGRLTRATATVPEPASLTLTGLGLGLLGVIRHRRPRSRAV